MFLYSLVTRAHRKVGQKLLQHRRMVHLSLQGAPWKQGSKLLVVSFFHTCTKNCKITVFPLWKGKTWSAFDKRKEENRNILDKN